MRSTARKSACLLTVLLAGACLAQAQNTELRINTESLERCVVNRVCTRTLEASGGVPPLQWRITKGTLPPNLRLNPLSGIISGVARSDADFQITVEVVDSGKPRQRASRQFPFVSQLRLDWKQPPVVHEDSITGS